MGGSKRLKRTEKESQEGLQEGHAEAATAMRGNKATLAGVRQQEVPLLSPLSAETLDLVPALRHPGLTQTHTISLDQAMSEPKPLTPQ